MCFLILFLTFVLVLQNHRKHTVSPFLSFGVASEQLIDVNGLRVQCIKLSVFTVAFVSLDEGLPDCGLAASRGTNDEHTMSDVQDLI